MSGCCSARARRPYAGARLGRVRSYGRRDRVPLSVLVGRYGAALRRECAGGRIRARVRSAIARAIRGGTACGRNVGSGRDSRGCVLMRRALVPSPELGGVRELPAAPVPTARQILCAVQELSSRLDRIEQLLAARGPVGDERHAGFLAALAESMADLDLPFTASEVLWHAAVDHPLGEALRAACEESTTTAIGTLFREIAAGTWAGCGWSAMGACGASSARPARHMRTFAEWGGMRYPRR